MTANLKLVCCVVSVVVLDVFRQVSTYTATYAAIMEASQIFGDGGCVLIVALFVDEFGIRSFAFSVLIMCGAMAFAVAMLLTLTAIYKYKVNLTDNEG